MITADVREVEVNVPSRMTIFDSVGALSEHSISRMIDPLACSEIARLEGEVGDLKRKVYELSSFRIEMESYRKVTESLAVELGILHKAVPFRGAPADAQKVISVTSSVFRVPVYKLVSKDRTTEVAYARMACMYVCRKHLDMGLKAIGKMFNRDHGTALHGFRRVTSMIKQSKAFKGKVEAIVRAVYVAREADNASSKTASDPDSRINKSLRKWDC